MPVWPGILPSAFRLGWNVQDEDAVIRTSMDAGPPSRRRRFTAPISTITGEMVLTEAQRAALLSFFRTDIKGGALAFDFPDPVDKGATISVALKSPPAFTMLSGGGARRLWSVALSLEVQP